MRRGHDLSRGSFRDAQENRVDLPAVELQQQVVPEAFDAIDLEAHLD
jgi:hypothetical protein